MLGLIISYYLIISIIITDNQPRFYLCHFLRVTSPSQPGRFEQPAYPSLDLRSLGTHELREDFHLRACFSQSSLWNTCGSSARKPLHSTPGPKTHTAHNSTAHLSNRSKDIPINNHATSSEFSTFPQGLLRLRVFRVLFTSSVRVVLRSVVVVLGMLPLDMLFHVFNERLFSLRG